MERGRTSPARRSWRRCAWGDEVAFQLKNGKDAAFVVADIADGVLTGCLFKGVRGMAMYDGRRWWDTDYVNYPESDARERLNEELLPCCRTSWRHCW